MALLFFLPKMRKIYKKSRKNVKIKENIYLYAKIVKKMTKLSEKPS